MIHELSRAGSRRRENQDALCSGSNRRYSVISLADGVSACREARTGAEIASRAITQLLLQRGERFLEFESRQIAELAVSHVLYELKEQTGADEGELEAYSSTVASVLFDKKRGRILCFSLGDSLILGTEGGRCRVLTMPSDSTEGCCVTTTRNASVMTQTKVMDVGGMESVLICSDGAWRVMFERNRLRPEVVELLTSDRFDALREFFARQDCADDCSVISMELEERKREGPLCQNVNI